jgi:ABC-2 type transport system permease protein
MMTDLVRAEVLKVRLTRSSWWSCAAAVVLVASAICLTLAFGTVRTGVDERSVLSFAGSGGLVILLLGVALGAGEYRHRTLIASLLVQPRRGRVWFAQATAVTAIGLVMGVALSVVAAAIVFPWLSAKGTPVRVSDGQLAAGFAGSIAYCGISAVIGLSIGALARNQVLAVSIVFLALAVVDPTISTLSSSAGRFGPSAVGVAMTGGGGSNNGPFQAVLSLPGAAGVWLGIGLVLFIAAAIRVRARDLD